MLWTVLIFSWLSVGTTLTSYCYPDYCQNSTTLAPIPGFQCVLTRVQTDEGCAKLKFPDSSAKKDASKFLLSAYVKSNGERTQFITAFNLSITDANFDRLVTRYQNLNDRSQAACRYIYLYGNQSHPPPTDLYVSCPFYNDSFESSSYRLQYLVSGKNYKYSRQHIFEVPLHSFIGEQVHLNKYIPFTYIDTSESPFFALYVQPYPKKYNVTKYRVWIINNQTNSVRVTDIVHNISSSEQIQFNFTTDTGVYCLKVSGVHPDCSQYGCANSTIPCIFIHEDSRRILIMIISTVWIPPVALYALYHIYKLYRKREILKRKRRPNCLLIYSPSRLTHINVMTELAKYLRGCNINAMIDMLDVAAPNDKDPIGWCNLAFRTAETIVIAASPGPKEAAVSSIYRDTQDHLVRLLKENAWQNGKTYCVVQFPYCLPDTVPEEARDFERFSLPKDLPRLVKALHKKSRTRRLSVSDGQLLDSIKLAKLELLEESTENKDTDEADGLLASGSTLDNMKHKAIPQSFMTNIDELNLLGETEESKDESNLYKQSTGQNVFYIDQLNL